ncbi:MAG: hypothetical protein COA42_03665 [Alteromonadaceae bacterium]|nr:MAG: hypothetical protein COA42_03665 [Alteromonadaceae bacterium]
MSRTNVEFDTHCVEIVELSRHAQCISQLSLWQHEQWLAGKRNLSEECCRRDIEGRTAQFEEHLTALPFPVSFIARWGSRPIGSVSLVCYDSDQYANSPESCWLSNLYVSPEHRRHGLGQSLIERVLSYGRQESLEKIMLFTGGLMPYYLSRGWAKVSEACISGKRRHILAYTL